MRQGAMADETALRFTSRVEPPDDRHEPAYWFVFQGDKLCARPNGHKAEVPQAAELAQIGITPLRQLYLGYLEDGATRRTHCYCAEVAADAPLPPGLIS